MDLSTIEEIVSVRSVADLAGWREGDAWLAGGSWLFSERQDDLLRLRDITALGWPSLQVDDGGLTIAATCTIADLYAARLPSQWVAASLIGDCCRSFLASFKIWNVATVGGNICASLPAGPMTSLAASVDATAEIWSGAGTSRTVPALTFVTGAGTNQLRPGEVLRSIRIPVASLTRQAAFRHASLTALGRSAALLIGLRDQQGGIDLTVSAATPAPVRIHFAQAPSADALGEALREAIGDEDYYDDVHGDPQWRRHLTHRLAREIMEELA
jgi:CO/xanthine dehydrogenase FAD-binding subunit